MADAKTLRKRRGVVRASVTRLEKRLNGLEIAPGGPGVSVGAKQLADKLEVLDADFRGLHLQLVDLPDESGELEGEQDTLDKHDDDITDLSVQLQQLIVKSSSPTINPDSHKKAPTRRLSRLERNLGTTEEA